MQTHAIYLARYLADRGYPIEVVTYRPDTLEERNAVVSFDAGLPFPVCRRLSRLSYWHNLDLLAEIGERFRPDLVYASTVFYGLVGARLGVPIVGRSVGNDVLRPWIAYPFRPGSRALSNQFVERHLYRAFQRLEHPEWAAALFRTARRSLMERSARAMTRILANSTFTEGLLLEAGVASERVELLVGGVDSARFTRPALDRAALRSELGLPADGYLILTACRLEPKKGVDFLLAAFARLRGRMPDSRLVVVGDGQQGRRVRALAGRLGLGDAVSFAGRVPHDRVHAYYWAADLFALASREYVHPATGVRDAETMGRVLCEANAAGVPVVASRSGGIPSVVVDGENGLLFEPDDPESFLRAVERVREEPGLAAGLVRRGEEVARTRHDWAVVLGAHERVFAETLLAADGASAARLS